MKNLRSKKTIIDRIRKNRDETNKPMIQPFDDNQFDSKREP